MIRRISNTRKYEPTCTGLKAMTALLVLREKVEQASACRFNRNAAC
jgi:hypothetical protein